MKWVKCSANPAACSQGATRSAESLGRAVSDDPPRSVMREACCLLTLPNQQALRKARCHRSQGTSRCRWGAPVGGSRKRKKRTHPLIGNIIRGGGDPMQVSTQDQGTSAPPNEPPKHLFTQHLPHKFKPHYSHLDTLGVRRRPHQLRPPVASAVGRRQKRVVRDVARLRLHPSKEVRRHVQRGRDFDALIPPSTSPPSPSPPPPFHPPSPSPST